MKNNSKNNLQNILLLALNKPRGYICSHKDNFNRPKIYDIISKSYFRKAKGQIHSVGRLDFNSQGLILLTNNVKIKAYFEAPSSKIARIYKIKVQGLLKNDHLYKIKKGIKISNIVHRVVDIRLIKSTKSYTWANVKLNEGKNRHIRKIFERLGFTITKLIRVQYGPYKLSTLKPGMLRELNFSIHKLPLK